MNIYAAAIAGAPFIGAKNIRNLIEAFHTAKDVWLASDDMIRDSHLLKPKAEDAFLSYRKEISVEQLEEKMYQQEIRCCTWEDEEYPSLLRNTVNPPAVLFYKGVPPVAEKTIAIVGSRKATAYGVQTAERLSAGLAENDVVVVSGGARGIDSAAHSGALQIGAPTIVVLACGVDRVYPQENRNLFQKIIDTGGTIISEYLPGTPPLGRQFPARNRIIAGMSSATVVVEAAERSGALITSDFALEEGRDVFSVPGNIWQETSKGTNQLIRSGAICCTSYEDILSEYNWGEIIKEVPDKTIQQLTLEEEVLYRFCCIGNEVTTEDILIQSGMSVAKVTGILLQLQLKGVIKEVGTGRFIITGKM